MCFTLFRYLFENRPHFSPAYRVARVASKAKFRRKATGGGAPGAGAALQRLTDSRQTGPEMPMAPTSGARNPHRHRRATQFGIEFAIVGRHAPACRTSMTSRRSRLHWWWSCGAEGLQLGALRESGPRLSDVQRRQHDLTERRAVRRPHHRRPGRSIEMRPGRQVRASTSTASPMRTAKCAASPVSRDRSSSSGVARLTISISSSALAASANSGRPIG